MKGLERFQHTNGCCVLWNWCSLAIVGIWVTLGDFVVELQVTLCGEVYGFCVLNWMWQLRMEAVFVSNILHSSDLVQRIDVAKGPASCSSSITYFRVSTVGVSSIVPSGFVRECIWPWRIRCCCCWITQNVRDIGECNGNTGKQKLERAEFILNAKVQIEYEISLHFVLIIREIARTCSKLRKLMRVRLVVETTTWLIGPSDFFPCRNI